jgi:Spy/CpxP family protein refolding chaperone
LFAILQGQVRYHRDARRMKMKRILILATALATVTAAVAAPGGGPFGGPGRGLGAKMRPQFGAMLTTQAVEMMAKRLDLTDEQKSKVSAIAEKARADIRGIGEKAKDDAMAVLTPEQREKAKDLREDIEERAESMRGRAFRPEPGEDAPPNMKGMGEMMELHMAVRQLDLSDEQKEKLKASREEMEKAGKAIREEVEPKMESLRKEARAKLDGVLTEEQRKQLDKELERVREWRSERPEGPGFGRLAGPRRGPGMKFRGPNAPDAPKPPVPPPAPDGQGDAADPS